MNKFELVEFRVQERKQINATRSLPTPARRTTFRLGNVARHRGVKILFHSRRLPRRHFLPDLLGANKRIDPLVVKRVKFERVFGRIEVCPEIVASQFRNARNHPRPGTAGRADHDWSQIDHADTCHGQGW